MKKEGISRRHFLAGAATVGAAAVAAPALLASMVIGLIIAIFQAATQIHEQTLTFVPKLIGIAVLLLITASWIMAQMNDFVTSIFDKISKL